MLQIIGLGLIALIIYLISDIVQKIAATIGHSKSNSPKGDVIDITNAWIDLQDMPYRTRDQFMNQAEINFYRLSDELLANSGYKILPKIPLAEIFDLEPHASQRQEYLRRIREHICDFLVCREAGAVPVLIVLTEGRHESQSAIQNREFVQRAAASTRFPVVTVNLDHMPDRASLQRILTRAGLSL